MEEKEWQNNTIAKTSNLEEKIVDMILSSGLDYYEVMGMLTHMQMEFHKLVDKGVTKFDTGQ